jgi:hypothetical protein
VVVSQSVPRRPHTVPLQPWRCSKSPASTLEFIPNLKVVVALSRSSTHNGQTSVAVTVRRSRSELTVSPEPQPRCRTSSAKGPPKVRRRRKPRRIGYCKKRSSARGGRRQTGPGCFLGSRPFDLLDEHDCRVRVLSFLDWRDLADVPVESAWLRDDCLRPCPALSPGSANGDRPPATRLRTVATESAFSATLESECGAAQEEVAVRPELQSPEGRPLGSTGLHPMAGRAARLGRPPPARARESEDRGYPTSAARAPRLREEPSGSSPPPRRRKARAPSTGILQQRWACSPRRSYSQYLLHGGNRFETLTRHGGCIDF